MCAVVCNRGNGYINAAAAGCAVVFVVVHYVVVHHLVVYQAPLFLLAHKRRHPRRKNRARQGTLKISSRIKSPNPLMLHLQYNRLFLNALSGAQQVGLTSRVGYLAPQVNCQIEALPQLLCPRQNMGQHCNPLLLHDLF